MSLKNKIIKKIIRLQMSGWADGSVAEQRARQEKTVKTTNLPKDVQCQPLSVDGVPAEWVKPPGADAGVLLYLHGGGYALGSINTHRELIARLARAAKLRALALDYRLAPENPFPAALEDATAAYRWLLTEGYSPGEIFIAGDSAGGGLTLATLLNLRGENLPLPAGGVCLSPWTDLSLTGSSLHAKAKADPMLDPESLQQYVRYYAAENDPTSPLISPLYANPEGLPPLLIQVGSDEILLDDAVRFDKNAQKAGVNVTLEVWDEMFHVFQIIPFLTESKRAVARIAEFILEYLQDESEKATGLKMVY